MGLEAATYIHQLDTNNPLAGDPVNVGDDHIRLIKAAVKATFPNVAGAVTPTHSELNFVDGVTSPIQAQLDVLAAAIDALQTGDIDFQAIWDALALKAPIDSPTFTTLAVLPANTTIGSVSAAELAYLDGLTGAIQTQFDAKAPLASPTFTGTVTLPTTTSVGAVSSTELGYLDGVTSAIQTQLNAKAAASHVHAASDVTSGTFADARVAQSNVTQHQAQLSIAATQVAPSGSISSSTSFTVSTSQREQLVTLTGGSPISVVIGDGHGFAQYESVAFERNSTSTVTFSTSGSQTLSSPGSRTTIPERYGVAVLTYKGSNAWLLSGV